MRKGKRKLRAGIVIGIACAACGTGIAAWAVISRMDNKKGWEQPEELLVQYMERLSRKEYEQMYAMLDSDSVAAIRAVSGGPKLQRCHESQYGRHRDGNSTCGQRVRTGRDLSKSVAFGELIYVLCQRRKRHQALSAVSGKSRSRSLDTGSFFFRDCRFYFGSNEKGSQ